MTHILPFEPKDKAGSKSSHGGQGRTKFCQGADEMLRDIAFVLKMSEHVRKEMDAEKKSEEPVLL